MADLKFTVERLGKISYDEWATRMEMLLNVKQLGDTIVANGVVTDAQDRQAKAIIGLHCESASMVVVKNANSARQAWTRLQQIYAAESRAQQVQLRRELNTMQKGSDESIMEYFARGVTLRDRLVAATGVEMSDAELAAPIFAGLPEDYQTAVDVLLAKTEEVSITDAMTYLMHREQRLKHNGDEGTSNGNTALMARRTDRDNNGNKSGRKCHYCKKPGHYKKECYKYLRDQRRNGGGGGGSRVALVAKAATTVAHHKPGGAEDSMWVLDSGASHHMTADKGAFCTYTSKTDLAVEMIDGTMVWSAGIGDVDITVETAAGVQDLRLRGVLHVPGVSYNLISIPQVTGAGAKVVFDAGYCNVFAQGKRLISVTAMKGVWRVPLLGGASAMAAVAKETPELWHRRYGHLGYQNLARLQREGMVENIKVMTEEFEETKVTCGSCEAGKSHKLPSPATDAKARDKLELIHMDVCGPMPVTSLGGARYYATLLDDATKLSVVIPIKKKSNVTGVVKEQLQKLERQSGCKVKRVRTDGGGEYCNSELSAYYKSKGIVPEKTAPHSPEMNGAAERLNRTLMEKAMPMLHDAGLPQQLWAEAVVTANFLRNRSPVTGLTITPYEAFFGVKPDVRKLRVFGCMAYKHVPAAQRRKLDDKSVKGRLVGYTEQAAAYRVYIDGDVVVSKDVSFDESAALQTPAAEMPVSGVKASATRGVAAVETETDASPHMEELTTAAEWPKRMEPKRMEPAARRSRGSSPARKKAREGNGAADASEEPEGEPEVARGLMACSLKAADVKVPKNEAEVEASPQREFWREADGEEMRSLLQHDTWDLVELPEGESAVNCMWVRTIKEKPDGYIDRFKSRCVAKGYNQRPGIDFDEVWAPVSKHTTLRMLLAKVAAEDLELTQLDVKTAFLNGELEETVYMKQPEGYHQGGPNIVCRLKKSLYGLRQAPRAWYLKLKKELLAHDFTIASADPGLWIVERLESQVYLLVYVDDILLASACKAAITEVEDICGKIFEVRKMGEAHFFLGMEIIRNRKAGTLKITQEKYIKGLLEKYDMLACKPKTLPVAANTKLKKGGEEDGLDTSIYPYMELVGALLHCVVCTRPDLAFIVGVASRFMSCPTWEHWQAVKGVLRYLKSTPGLGIVYKRGDEGLLGYTDSDFAGDLDTKRSTGGYVYNFNGAAVSWQSKLLPTVALSTTEAEYMAAALAAKEALWLQKLCGDLGYPTKAITLYCDNQAAEKLSKLQQEHQRSKHIGVQYHFLRERVALGELKVEYCATEHMVADVLTKAVGPTKYKWCVEHMGML